MLRLFELLWSNVLLRYMFLYYMVGVAIWTSYIFMVSTIKPSKVTKDNIKKLNIFFLFISTLLTLTVLMLALDYVGFLPYGPDTNGYTYVHAKLLAEGHWRGKGYYAAYHTSAVFLSITTMVVSSMQLSYIILLVCFILFLGLVVSTAIRSIYGSILRHGIILLISFMLFLSSPQLGGFDLLQQFVSSVYGVTSVLLLIGKLNNESKVRSAFTVYMVFATIAIVTHLTSVLLILMLLVAYLASIEIKRNRWLKIAITYPIAVGLAYTIFSAYGEARNIVNSLYNLFESLGKDGIKSFTIRAYEEIPRTRISLFAWTLLPSLVTAYLVTSIIVYVICNVKRLKIKEYLILVKDKFLMLSSIFAMLCLFFAIVSRFTPVEIARYFWQPSSMAMLAISTMALCKTLKKAMQNARGVLVFSFLLMLLTPYLYSALNDPSRMPAMGEPRLAPVTYLDRIEMLPLAAYGIEGYHVYAWHDVRIPVEWTSKVIRFKGGGSYYPIYDILLKVARDIKVEVPMYSYLILRKEVIKVDRFENYNIVFNGIEHLVLTPSWPTS